MKVVKDRLATDGGVMLLDPPYEKTEISVIKAPLFNKGMKENGAVFQHTQGWVVMSEAILGNGQAAYDYFRAFMPAAYNTKAEVREIEPYVYAQSTNSKHNPRYGAARLPWLTGAATWSYFSATQYIMGVQPDYEGLRIDPCVPATWKEFGAERRFRGKQFRITFKNPNGVQKGVKEIIVNGETIKGNLIPVNKMVAENVVEVIMG